MKRIPLHKLEEFRKQWQGEVADVFDDFLRSKATCISDRMEKELVEVRFGNIRNILCRLDFAAESENSTSIRQYNCQRDRP